MKIFVAGATGALGRRLVPLLVKRGHSVAAMTRTPNKSDPLRAAGAEPFVADALDASAVMAVLKQAAPEVVIHELTAIPAALDLKKWDSAFAATNRLRTEGTANLLAAARAVGARRFVAQSYGAWPYARTGGPAKTEDDPLDPNPPAAMRRTLDAIQYLEKAVGTAPGVEGVVLRYGGFYGPGTSLGEGGAMLEPVRRRKIPIVGDGAGVWSFLHIDDAAQATLVASERGAPGIYNIADDEPAPVSEWLPALARAIEAKPPRRVPVWLARLAIGEPGVVMMTQIRGASNQKAKRELGWQPFWKSWREGFQHGLADG